MHPDFGRDRSLRHNQFTKWNQPLNQNPYLPRATLEVVKDTRWPTVGDLRLVLFPQHRYPPQAEPVPTLPGHRIGFVPPRHLVAGDQPPNWLRFVISHRRPRPAPSASRRRLALFAPARRSSCANLLIQFELTRNWVRSVNSSLPLDVNPTSGASPRKPRRGSSGGCSPPMGALPGNSAGSVQKALHWTTL